VAGFALALAMITGLAVGLIPAWRASSATVTGLLTSGGRDAGGRTGRLR
jgi:hypothetical protein